MSADDKTEQQNVEGVADLEPSDGVEIDKTADEADEAQQDDEHDRADTTSRLGDEVARRRRVKIVPLRSRPASPAVRRAGGVVVRQSVPARSSRPTPQPLKAAIDAARDGTVALLSYKPDTLNQDFAAAKSHLTGDFLNYYDQFTQRDRDAGRQGKGADNHRSGGRCGGVRTAAEFSGRVALRQPGHHQQGPARSGDGVEQRAGVVDQGPRHVADHQVPAGLSLSS